MATTPKVLPKLVQPKVTITLEPEINTPASVAYDEQPLKLRTVTGLNLQALFVNLISVTILFLLMVRLIGTVTYVRLIQFGLPLAIICGIVIIIHKKLWVLVDARKAIVYLDNLTGWMKVYMKGFHFVPWYSSLEDDEIDFQKWEEMTSENNTVTFQTLDGYKGVVDLNVQFCRRDTEEALSWSLKYKTPELRSRIWAVVKGRISDIAGCNNYETMIRQKRDFTEWVGMIFGGDKMTSDFEAKTGTEIKCPVAGDLGLTPESQRVWEARSKIGIIEEGIRNLLDAGGSAATSEKAYQEASATAQAAVGTAVRRIETYQGVPEGVTVLALGQSGMAVAADNQSKKGK